MTTTGKIVCDKCEVRLPKNRPRLICGLCDKVKHYRCQRLSRADAEAIINDRTYDWTCIDCFAWMLPVNACATVRTKTPTVKFKIKCNCCSGYSYSPRTTATCPWCDQRCHVKCLNGSLGCHKCCDSMIPGFRVNTVFSCVAMVTETVHVHENDRI